MIIALKKEATQYFDLHPDKLEWYTSLVKDKQVRKFYSMLIVHSIEEPSVILNIVSQLVKLQTIKWGFFLQSVWAISLNFKLQSLEMKKLAQVITQINVKNLIDKNTLLNQLPDSLINLAGLIQQQNLDKKTQRAYTKINYQQNKYSLMRQNNEGFAKISILLLTLKSEHNFDIVWQKIISLVGNFDLDPDRVLDLILEAYINRLNNSLFILLLQKFNAKSLCTLIGQRLLKAASKNDSQTITYLGSVQNFMNVKLQQLYKQNPFIPNPKLITMTAKLLKHQLIKLQQIYPYLLPDVQIIQKIQMKKITAGKHKIQKSFKMLMEQLQPKQKQKQIVQDQKMFMGQLIYSTKLALLAQLVKINDWNNFLVLWKIFQGNFDLLSYQALLNNLLNLLEWTIDPIFSHISYSHFFTQESNIPVFTIENTKKKQMKQYFKISEQFYENINQLLKIIGPYIGFRTTLFLKFCRLFKKLLKKQSDDLNNINLVGENDQKQYIKEIIKNYLLPGSLYQTNNPTLSIEIYQILQNFDYRFRYDCYLKIYKKSMSQTPYVCKTFEQVKNQQNIIVNNLSKDNKKVFLKKMAKLTHNQAIPVLYWVVRRLLKEDYEAVVPQIVSALSNCTSLTLQMTVFMMLYTLTEQTQPPSNKHNQSLAWYKNTIMFLSYFFRKYVQIDIQPIFDFMITKLGQSIIELQDNEEMPNSILKLLQGLLNKMYGSIIIQQVNKSKYQILASGHRLQFEALYLASDFRAAKKSKQMLQSYFLQKSKNYNEDLSLMMNLSILLAQKRSQFFHKSYISDIKTIGDIYDEYCVVFMHLIRYLNFQTSNELQYSKLLPQNSFSVLINKYKIPIQFAFQIIRPSIKHISLMNKQQFEDVTLNIKTVVLQHLKGQNNLIKGYNVGQKLSIYLNSYKQKFEKLMPFNFYTAFWLLTLDSIYFPSKIYHEKIEQLRKKIQQNIGSKKTDKIDRETQKYKVLFEKLSKQEEVQKKKYEVTVQKNNLLRFLQLEVLNSINQDKNQSINAISQFAQLFVQMCLLPRLLMESTQALYSVKFIIELIKINKLSPSKSIKLLTHIIESIMNYLPFTTERQASNCLSIFLSELLGIFTNWHDQVKLKDDMKKKLGIQEFLVKDKYPKIKQYLLKLFERVGNLIKSIKGQPYIIKNCLYLLEKLDAIPSYKQQAQQLQLHLKQLKDLHSTVDMKTILQRQISILNNKKNFLPQKPQQRKKPTPIHGKFLIQTKDNNKEGSISPNQRLKKDTQISVIKQKDIVKDQQEQVHNINNRMTTKQYPLIDKSKKIESPHHNDKKQSPNNIEKQLKVVTPTIQQENDIVHQLENKQLKINEKIAQGMQIQSQKVPQIQQNVIMKKLQIKIQPPIQVKTVKQLRQLQTKQKKTIDQARKDVNEKINQIESKSLGEAKQKSQGLPQSLNDKPKMHEKDKYDNKNKQRTIFPNQKDKDKKDPQYQKNKLYRQDQDKKNKKQEKNWKNNNTQKLEKQKQEKFSQEKKQGTVDVIMKNYEENNQDKKGRWRENKEQEKREDKDYRDHRDSRDSRDKRDIRDNRDKQGRDYLQEKQKHKKNQSRKMQQKKRQDKLGKNSQKKNDRDRYRSRSRQRDNKHFRR